MLLIRILRCFELSSGLKINMSKSRLFGFGVQDCELDMVARSFNCLTGSLPFTYLGLPVGASMTKVSLWKPIIDKFQAKLSRWKASTLSFGGTYKGDQKPQKNSNEVFFWGGCLESKKMAWIAWDKILAAKEKGGLGVGSLKAKQPDSIWALVIKAIHGPDGGISRPTTTKRRSGCWGSIVCLPATLGKDQVPFLNHFQHELNIDGSSKWIWSLDPSGEYTVSSMQNYFDNLVLPQSIDNWMWNPLVPDKLNILAWRVC
uniref:Reverse transcriptase zinc-binding domain-containing protein n=1 Tax=Lactuca sativa TaxID=4236 RepID=A0A9R1UCT1_LACSA|nr:hypothetical protein LSAT_V11C900477670 [Lactuca sativa]